MAAMGGARICVHDRKSARTFAWMRYCIILQLMASSAGNNVAVPAGKSGETSDLSLKAVGTTHSDVNIRVGVHDAPNTGMNSGMKQAGIWISTWYALEGNYIWAKNFAPQQHVSTRPVCSVLTLECTCLDGQWCKKQDLSKFPLFTLQ